MLDEDRTGLHARPARHTVPHGVVWDGIVDDRLCECLGAEAVVEPVGLADDRAVRDEV